MDKQEIIVKVLNTLELIEIKGSNNVQLMYGLMIGLKEELDNEVNKKG